VDAQDVMGSHIVDVGGRLFKTRLDGNGYDYTIIHRHDAINGFNVMLV
jgi:serine protease inhibitor ecotin